SCFDQGGGQRAGAPRVPDRGRGDRCHLRTLEDRRCRRDVPSVKSPQLTNTTTGAAPNGTVYEPVTSERSPAAAGPSAAPERQPSVSTPMMAPIARIPK